MMTPQWISRLALVAALCAGLYLAEQGHVPDTTPYGQATQAEENAQQTNGGLKVVLKPGFDQDHPSRAEIDLLATLLPEFLEKWLEQQGKES